MIQPKIFSRHPLGSGLSGVKELLLVDRLLREWDQFAGEIGRGSGLAEKIRSMLISSFILMALYGLLLGSTHSLGQSLSSAAKLPLLFLATLFICAPALYMFNILAGVNQRLGQSVALVLAAISVTAVLLLSFAPITLFFTLTVPDSYQFFKLLNVFFFGIAGSIGAARLSQGLKVLSSGPGDQAVKASRLVFGLWLAVYCFVGSQMAWTLRPFVGYPSAPFELFRQFGGNFYTDILASVGEILGFIIVK